MLDVWIVVSCGNVGLFWRCGQLGPEAMMAYIRSVECCLT